ncbi:peptidase domain-containing ABC transporter [Empedobacter tilapiae]
MSEEKFLNSWLSDEKNGVAIFLTPTSEFYKRVVPKKEEISINFLFKYLTPYKKEVLIIFFMLLFTSIITLIFPFLTEALIDKGINKKNLNFITIILISQLTLFFSSMVFSIFQNYIILYMGSHLSINIITDFLKKLLKLSIKYFDTKLIGDFQQRIQDNDRIEEFLTSKSISTFFSIITFSVFFGVLWYYDLKIVLVFLTLTIISIIWSLYWLKKRKILDYYRFQQRSENQGSIHEILDGIIDIKLNQFENYKINKWNDIQIKLLETNTRILKIDQIQSSGFEFINQLKNITVTFLTATYVVKGNMTLGMLLSISYIIGQINSPINQLISFFRSLQDAKLSLERLNEIKNISPDENTNQKELLVSNDVLSNNRGIFIENLYFQYEGSQSPFVLNNINLHIPEGKITAIVGSSGSGKTTLMKLLLRFYNPSQGRILYNQDNILDLSPESIRTHSGIVMQDGYIFSETIERNIAMGDININENLFEKSLKIANLSEFIETLPLKGKTLLNSSGDNISGGQKQRILIARAVYKNPHYILFDEATSALDSENEKIIHNNLKSFFKGKTVLIIAHRLSTVKNADKIIVLRNGHLIEEGSHEKLLEKKSEYFNLIKNQLNLDH